MKFQYKGGMSRERAIPATPLLSRLLRRRAGVLVLGLLLLFVSACGQSEPRPAPPLDGDQEQDTEATELEQESEAERAAEDEIEWPQATALPRFALILSHYENFAADLKTAQGRAALALVFSGDYLSCVEDLDEGDAAATDRLARLASVISQTRQAGLEAWIISRSFGRSAASLCLAAESSFWPEREALYDRVLDRLPGLSGLVISFGDAVMAPWEPLCICEACRNAAGHLDPYAPPKSERVALEIQAAAKAVVHTHGLGFVLRVKSGDSQALGIVGQAGASRPEIPFARLHALPLEGSAAFGSPDFSAWQWDARDRLYEITSQEPLYGPAIMGGMNPDTLPWLLSRLPAPHALWLNVNSDELGADPWPLLPPLVERLSREPTLGAAALYDELLAKLEPTLDAQTRQAWLSILSDSWRAALYAHDNDGLPALSTTRAFPVDTSLSGLNSYQGDLSILDPRYLQQVAALKRPVLDEVIQNWNEDAAAVALSAAALARYDELAARWPVSWAQTVRPRLAAQDVLVRIWQQLDLFTLSARLRSSFGPDPSADSYLQGAFERLILLREELKDSILLHSASVGLDQLDRYLITVKSLKPSDAPAVLPSRDPLPSLHFAVLASGEVLLSFLPPRTAQYTVSYGPHPQTLSSTLKLSLLPANIEVRQIIKPTPGSTTFFRLSVEGGGQNDQGPIQWFFLPPSSAAR